MLRHPVERVLSLYFISSKAEWYQLQKNNTQTLYVSGGNSPDFKKAKKNLRRFFTVVGITEMFDESLSLMKNKLNWNDISYLKVLLNKQRPAKEDLSPDILAKIKSKNELDFKLYYWARQNLKEVINNTLA
jgi:hypothetical protein